MRFYSCLNAFVDVKFPFTLPGSKYKCHYKYDYYLAVAQSALFGKVGEVKDAVEELKGVFG